MTKTLGTEIRRLRQEADYTLRHFAGKILEISPAHQSDIEHGRRLPSDDLLRKIVDRLAHVGASLEELKKLDARIDPDLGEWIARTPEASQMLREVRDAKKSPKEVLNELKKLLESDRKKGQDESQ